MMKINYKFVLVIICAALFFSITVGEAFARSKGFGGFSSSRSFSSKRSFSKSTFNWGKSKTRNQKTGLSNTRRKSSAGRMSSSDRALYNKAKTSNTVFNSKTDALKTFKAKHGSKYPTKFSSQPAIRPDYIPPNITLKGNRHKVFYRNGGYGYFIGSAWFLYSPLNDDREARRLMAGQGYYYGPRPGLSFMSILGMGMTLFLLLTILKSFVASMGQGQGRRQFTNFK